LLSDQIAQDELQDITFHPGTVFGAGWEEMGATKELLPFDEGNTAIINPRERETDCDGDSGSSWCIRRLGPASKEAAYANGRVLWASWDVKELASGYVRKRMEVDDDYLRISVVGLKGTERAPAYD
jgi:hypothetical protein